MAVIQRVIDCPKEKVLRIVRGTLLTAADVDAVVTSANMKVGAYTVEASQPSAPGYVTVAVTAGATADTMGTITVVGTSFGVAATDVITPVADSSVTGSVVFDAGSITSVTGAGWAIDEAEGTEDTITVGVLMSSEIRTKGHRVTLGIITGNVWINPLITAVEGTTAIPLIAGDLVQNMRVSDTLSLIADSSGGTFYAIVWDD